MDLNITLHGLDAWITKVRNLPKQIRYATAVTLLCWKRGGGERAWGEREHGQAVPKAISGFPREQARGTIYVSTGALKAWVEDRELKRCPTCGIASPASRCSI
jgi:hypothetical protein